MPSSSSSFSLGLVLGLTLGVLALLVPEARWMRTSLSTRATPPSSTLKSPLHDGSVPSASVTNYWKNPVRFLSILRSCEINDNCRIYYEHSHKTGGTTLEFFMQEHFSLEHHKSCCDEARVKKFYRHRDEYCRLKFLSHEVNASAFFALVQDCVEQWPSETGLYPSPTSPVVILTSFRDPVQMMVSQVNQLCNKNLEKRSESILQACRACSYDQHTDVWLQVIDFVTQQLQNSYQVAYWNTTAAVSILANANLHILAIEATDLDDFLQAWQPQLWKKSNVTRFNPEDVSFCRFAAPSDMLRAMAHAQELYRKLLLL